MHKESTALVVRDQEVLAPGQNTLDELAAIANEEHRQVREALGNALIHAIAAGEALNEARSHFANRTEWAEWCDSNFNQGLAWAKRYSRLAFYKTNIPDELFSSYRDATGARTVEPGVTRALAYLKGLPPIRVRPRMFDWDEANRLHQEGMSYREIADVFNVSEGAVMRACNPHIRERSAADTRKYRAKMRKLRDAEHNRMLAKARKDGVGETWSLIRRALDEAQRCVDDSRKGSEVRKALRESMTHLYSAEDAIAKALKVTT